MRRKIWGDVRGAHRLNVPHARIAVTRAFSSFHWFRDKDFLIEQYVTKEKSLAQIAHEVGCARATVVTHLMEFGIEIRQDGLLPHYLKSQTAYGEKNYGGRVVPHLGELAIIEQFLKLRKQGLSYEKLARWANHNQIPTKNKVGRWDRRTIFEILRRRLKPRGKNKK